MMSVRSSTRPCSDQAMVFMPWSRNTSGRSFAAARAAILVLYSALAMTFWFSSMSGCAASQAAMTVRKPSEPPLPSDSSEVEKCITDRAPL